MQIVPILYRWRDFDAFGDFSDFVESVSYGTSKTCQVRGSSPCRDSHPVWFEKSLAAGQLRWSISVSIVEAYAGVLRKVNDYAGAEKASVRALGIQVRNSLHP